MEQKNIMDLLIIVGSLGAMLWGMMRFMLRDIHKDLMEIKENSRKHEEKMLQVERRIDQLFQISVDLLKDKK